MKDYQPTIVALLDKPSTQSFGMTRLIVTVNSLNEMYQTTGLASRNRAVTPYELNQQLNGHILKVQSLLPGNLSNPVALWLGTQFYTKATTLNAPSLPVIDEHWHQPLEPHFNDGKYTVKEPAEAYKILDGWVTETAREALVRKNYDLAVLTRWTLPMHPATKAALYFTAADSEKERELDWQLLIDRRKISVEVLKQEHEKVRSQLLERK